jgi:hypothetical protein
LSRIIAILPPTEVVQGITDELYSKLPSVCFYTRCISILFFPSSVRGQERFHVGNFFLMQDDKVLGRSVNERSADEELGNRGTSLQSRNRSDPSTPYMEDSPRFTT